MKTAINDAAKLLIRFTYRTYTLSKMLYQWANEENEIMTKTVKWIQVNLIIQFKAAAKKKFIADHPGWSLSLLEIKSRSLKRKQRSNRPYLYSSSSINAPEKWVSAGEIDPGLDNTCFITVGDISVDFTAFVSSAMFCFLCTCLGNRVPATSNSREG